MGGLCLVLCWGFGFGCVFSLVLWLVFGFFVWDVFIGGSGDGFSSFSILECSFGF